MRQTKLNFKNLNSARFLQVASTSLLVTASLLSSAAAQQSGQKTFSSAEQASSALVAATQSNDEKAMLEILGRDAKSIVNSGDEAEDSAARANFVEKYQQMHRLVKEPDGTTVLYIGAENWPTPIPLVEKSGAWYFDSEEAKKEILYRRIGRNEISAIRVCEELVAAQKEFQSAHNEYAQKIFSDEGQHNGLYWKSSEGEPQSPIGPLVAQAAAGGQTNDQGTSTPFRGYYFHALVRQGKNAAGGAKDYVVNGKMTEGFAFVAYPAEYRSSGVMTMIVNNDGTVYEKDLGKKTEAIARSMNEYNPDPSWHKAEDQDSNTAAK